MIAIIDYGVGNLFSLKSSFQAIGEDVIVTSNINEINNCNKIILPGVGAFSDAADKLRISGLGDVVKEEAKRGKPILGICLGMQLLFEKSFEFGEWNGLGLIPGEIVPLQGKIRNDLKIPHIGWNPLIFTKSSLLFKNIKNGDCVYFVHSFYASCDPKYISANTEYGNIITASVEKDNVFGCQFHPEKSGNVGLNILRAFCEYT